MRTMFTEIANRNFNNIILNDIIVKDAEFIIDMVMVKVLRIL